MTRKQKQQQILNECIYSNIAEEEIIRGKLDDIIERYMKVTK